MYRGVKFGEFHTAADWGMSLAEKSIEPPKPKTKTISIEGRDGDIDLSESLGVLRYDNRSLSFKFELLDGTYQQRLDIMAAVLRHIHGKRLKVTLDDDSDYYFIGRCTVKSYENNRAMGTIEIEVDADPYRLKVVDTVRTASVIGDSVDVVCQNLGMKTVVPLITVTGNVSIGFDGVTNSLETGRYEINTIKFSPGDNYIHVSGTGDVVFTFQEARF